jgi:hypothetical protein
VSVVFVELAPTGLGGQADPEDLRELISSRLAQTMTEVEAFGGTVASALTAMLRRLQANPRGAVHWLIVGFLLFRRLPRIVAI